MFSNLSSVFLPWAPSGRKARNFYTCSPANTRARWPPTNHAQWSPLYLRHPRRRSTDGSRLDAIGCHSTHTIRSTTQSTDDHPTVGSAAGYLFASLYFRLPLTRLHSNKTGVTYAYLIRLLILKSPQWIYYNIYKSLHATATMTVSNRAAHTAGRSLIAWVCRAQPTNHVTPSLFFKFCVTDENCQMLRQIFVS